MKNQKIAVIGSGISGLGFSYICKYNNQDITLFEKSDYYGGHSNTIDIALGDKAIAVDTGFLVHNKVTYPNLIQLFDLLDVEIVDSQMSLSIQVEDMNLEWGGQNLNTVFGQRINLLKPKFYKFLKEILHFNKNATDYLLWAEADKSRSLGDLLKEQKYTSSLINWYIVPMAAAIWSTPADKMLNFPAFTFLNFAMNHHLLQVNNRPVWRTLKGGSRNYVNKISDQISDKQLNSKITEVEYKENYVIVKVNGQDMHFDKVVFACHADQALRLIKNPTAQQVKMLNSFKFEKNIAFVHSDLSFLPKRKRLWAAWNYNTSQKEKKVSVTYLINELQPLDTEIPILVTLNPHKLVDEKKLYKVIEYDHPLFDSRAIDSQLEIDSIQGESSMYFIGAWQGYGFHEDGLKSAVRLAKLLNMSIPWNENL